MVIKVKESNGRRPLIQKNLMFLKDKRLKRCEHKEGLCEGAEQMRGHNHLPTGKSKREASPKPSAAGILIVDFQLLKLKESTFLLFVSLVCTVLFWKLKKGSIKHMP